MAELNYSKKQLKPLIEKFNIDTENDKKFANIIHLFEGQTNYHIWAIKAVYNGIANIETIKSIKAWAENNHEEIKNLINKNIVSYKTKEDFKLLLNEMEGLMKIRFAKDIINRFNTRQREMLKENIFSKFNNGCEAKFSRPFKEWCELFKQMITLPKHRQEKLISTASAIEDITFLIKHIKNALEESYEWNKVDMLGYMARNCSDCSVVFESENVVIITVPSFKSSQKMCGGGRTGWCLTREEHYFNNYVTSYKDAIQYFLFDFSKREDHELAHVGFTVRNGQITNAHSTMNNSLVGEGYNIDGKMVNIQKVLEMDNVSKNVFIRLKTLRNYKWGVDEFLNWVNQNVNDFAISYSKNNRVVLNILNSHGLEKILNHTLIRYDGFSVNDRTKHYILLDFNKDVNDEKSIISFYFTKDNYNTDTLYRIYDAYNTNITDDNYLSKIDMAIDDFLHREKIPTKILLHKLIDERDEKSIVKLLSQDENLDVNFEFNNRTPIFSIIENKLYNAFKAIINHKNFDSSVQNSYGEALLQSLLYDYGCPDNTNEEMVSLKKMIDIIIESKNFDLNAINFNDDSAINVAAEKPDLLWVVEKLVNNPNVNVNVINDFNCSSFTNALRKNNFEAAKLIGKRVDLVVREEDKALINKLGANIKDFIKPTPLTSSTVVGTKNEPKVSNYNFADVFAKALSMK